MKLRHTIALLTLLLVLCALYYGVQHRREQREAAMRVARKVFTFEPEELQRLSIDRIDGPPCVAERDETGAWRIVEPNPTIAPFQLMWERVAANLAQLMNEHTVAAQPGDLGQYGLDPPELVTSGQTQDGLSFELRFGVLEPTQRHRYAQLDGGPLFLVDKGAFFELNRSLTDLRHRYLVDDREASLLEIDFAWIWGAPDEEETEEMRPDIGAESIAVIVRRDDAAAPWRITAPEEGPANHATVQALADEVQFAVSLDFIDNPEDLRDYGLDPPRARISVKDAASGRRQTLWLGAPDESPDRSGIFARREHEDAVLVIDPHIITLLPGTPLEWRDRRLLTRRVTDINRLEYSTSHDAFTLEKSEDGNWRLTAPVMDHVNEFAVSGFLSFFKDIEGDAFVEGVDKKTAFEEPAARIALRFEDNAEAEILIAAHPEDPDTILAVQDTGGVVTLSKAATRMLLTDSENFRSRELLRFIKADVETLAFTFEGEDYLLVKRHGQWRLQAPESMALHNQADVHTLMDAVNPLYMTGAVVLETPDNLDIYGLDAPVFDLEITVGEDVPPKTLHIGAPTPANPDERYTRTSERSGVYRISQEVMDEIREALRGIH